MDQIIIKQQYFDNIKIAVDGINKFFETKFQKKSFPVDTTDLDWAIANIIELLEDLDPAYVSDNSKLDQTLDMISERINNSGSMSNGQIMMNRPMRNAVQSIVSYAALIDISNNFDTFSKFINGIYSFELFTKPSKYKNEIIKFSSNIQIPNELEDMDLETSIFDVNLYITNLFNNSDITFPESFDMDGEIERMMEYRDLQNAEVVIADNPKEIYDSTDEYPAEEEQPTKMENEPPIEEQQPEMTEEAYMESAVFSCENIRYTNGKFQISKQYKSEVDRIVSNLRKCEDVNDLHSYLNQFHPPHAIDIPYPFIIVKALSSRLNDEGFEALRSEYKLFISKAKQKSASRISKYSIYDTFKIDKDATINFIEDYFRLNLVNNPSVSISNNIILSLFNIFDSNQYLKAIHNVKENDDNVVEFVKMIRGRINQNSKATNTYQKSTRKTVNTLSNDADEIEESIDIRIKDYGTLTTEETQLMEAYQQILFDEIEMVEETAYNNGMSKNDLESFIDEESYTIIESMAELFRNRPAARGEVPAYMLSRMDVSDTDPNHPMSKQPEVTDIPDPAFEDLENSVDQLADSVNEKMDMDGNLDELIGNKFDKSKADGRIVYNITYNNSFNKTSTDSHATTNDLSTNKTVTNTNRNANNRTMNSHNRSNMDSNNARPIPPKNNNDNSNNSLDSKEFNEHVDFYWDRTFSNGMTVAEMFMLFESEEPLSMEAATISVDGSPSADSLTRAMDRDRKSLAKTQEAKKKFQKFGNTIRAKAKPVSRVKQWLTNVVNSLVERDENKVKEEIIENPSYRTALYKALRLSVKLGLLGVAFTVSTWIGTALTVLHVAKFADKQRLRREVQDEMVTELKVLDEKIEYARRKNNQQELYRLLRVRGKLQGIAADSSRGRWVAVKPQRHWY